MSYHGNRIELKDGVSPEEGRAALEVLDRAGREIPVVRSYTVGQDVGSDYDITDDLDPDFRDKVAEPQRRHVESDAELAVLMAALPVSLGSNGLPDIG